jgi:hypothetical protein
MTTGKTFEASRREFLLACGAAGAYGLTGGALALGDSESVQARPVLHVETDLGRALIPVLSWDTEGTDRWRTNLLRKAAGVGLRVRSNDEWHECFDLPVQVTHTARGVHYRIKVSSQTNLLWEVAAAQDTLSLTFSVEGKVSFAPGAVELVFPFDPMVTPSTVLPSQWNDDGSIQSPMIVSAPDFGQMLLRVSPMAGMKGRLLGSRRNHTVDLILELPQLDESHGCTLSLTPLFLPAPEGLQDQNMWRQARRGWFNAFQPSARWGEQNRTFSSPAGILANNVVSDPCSMSLMFYADQMLWTPAAAAGISLANLVRRSVEFWLEQRTRTNGEVVGYWDFGNFLDANAGPVIAAWDYVEATGDLAWLEKTIQRLEFISDFLARRDQDRDGLVEAVQSGNANTLIEPDRSCIWMDAVNHGHKDAYANAIIYRSWRCLADLEFRLHRADRCARYTGLADRLKAAYRKTLFNSETGWIADWRSEDGKLHDYASPYTNGIAIEYGLIGLDDARGIVNRLWAKMRSAGFRRFELGLPPNLVPIRREDYLQPHALGCPQREDGADTFQRYENGGITGAQTLPFLMATCMVGQQELADSVLRKMLTRQQAGGFQSGVQNSNDKGADWSTWEGKPCGYEGYLADVYSFLMAVPLREPAMRQRFLKPFAAPTDEGPLPR